jgi:BNR repeat-containing family member
VSFFVSSVFGGVTLNQKDTGFRGIWYSNSRSGDEYVYKYSGGLGTYCAKHRPFAVYCTEVEKTFFCYGGTTEKANNQLLHDVSFYDHKTGQVAAPTIVLDKKTSDAHDNPVISVDDEGYVWIFSTSHGTSRPSYIHKSKKPYDIEEFEKINPTRIDDSGKVVAMDNFSYFQVWRQKKKGFVVFFTRYGYPVRRTICFMNSVDGVTWSKWQRLATIEKGSYQISAVAGGKAGSAFNIHPIPKGLDYRTNLYYVETTDCGKSWHSADGKQLTLPLTIADKANSSALVRDYQKEGLNVYLKDIVYDSKGNPVILYVTSGGWRPGPKNAPRTWTTAHWKDDSWQIKKITASDNSYDMGSLYIEADGK